MINGDLSLSTPLRVQGEVEGKSGSSKLPQEVAKVLQQLPADAWKGSLAEHSVAKIHNQELASRMQQVSPVKVNPYLKNPEEEARLRVTQVSLEEQTRKKEEEKELLKKRKKTLLQRLFLSSLRQHYHIVGDKVLVATPMPPLKRFISLFSRSHRL